MTRTATLLTSACLALTSTAQNWTVGVPVDMLLYTQTFYGGCTPNADYTWTFPSSPVTGVDYLVKITAMDPPEGSLSILPGLPNGGLADELLFDTTIQRMVIFAPGTTSAVLEFRAQGTPEVAGEVHPCSASPFWISDLVICPEGLFPNVDDGCTVQAGSTSVACFDLSKPSLQWPTTRNGQQLRINLPFMETAAVRIVEVSGRTVLSRTMGENIALDLSAFIEGVYVLELVRSTGDVLTKRFLLSRQ